MFCFLRFFFADKYFIPKILAGAGAICFHIIGAYACAGSNNLPNKRPCNGVLMDTSTQKDNIFSKYRGSLFEIIDALSISHNFTKCLEKFVPPLFGNWKLQN